MKNEKVKPSMGEKLKRACENLSEKQRKGVLIGMLLVSIILCSITITRTFARLFSHNTRKELPIGRHAPADSLYRTDKDSIMYHSKSMDNGR